MQRVWAVVLAVWAMLAIVAVLAWSYRPVAAAPTAAAQTMVVKTANGKQQVVVLKAPAASHATTATSGVVRP